MQTNLVNFCFDHLSYPKLGYPNLAKPDLSPDQFDTTWPRTLPVRLFSYFHKHNIEHGVWLVSTAPKGSWYPVALGWHDFTCDYFALMLPGALERVRAGEIRVLFYYHEGDNPSRIKQRLDSLCLLHQLPSNSYVFVSANSASQLLDNFLYFPDHELFFAYINRLQSMESASQDIRRYDFTALNRTHKWWRATCMADLERQGLLQNSLWSYTFAVDVGDDFADNPIEIDSVDGLRTSLDQFINRSPFWCDHPDADLHNDHRKVNLDLYHQSYCHIVLETHFDADQSGGTFLTEKTYKCIKYGQPFVIVGPPGSIQCLRDRGYRVFDHVIDHSYDNIHDNTKRWLASNQTIAQVKSQLSQDWLARCQPDLEWNQLHFANSHRSLLIDFMENLTQLNTGTL